MHITPFLGVLVLNMVGPVQFYSVGVNPSKEVEQQEVKNTCADIANSPFRLIFRGCSPS